MNRTLTALAAALLLAASGVYAQPPAAPARPVASPFSPLVYDALGATPKIELRRARKADAAPVAQKAEARGSAAAAARTAAQGASTATTH